MWRKFNHNLFIKIKKAVREYQMIQENDKVALGVSGGKDSMLLLYSMAIYKKISPINFEIIAVSIDMGWGNDLNSLKDFCESLEIPLHIKETEIGNIIFNVRQEKNPCALCAKMRRGALYSFAKELGCNKIALGHHLNDVLETFMLCLAYEGRLYTFAPKLFLSRVDIELIRPLVFVREEDVSSIINKLKIPIVKNLCPVDGKTKRQEAKDFLNLMTQDNPLAKERILSAIVNQLWNK